MDGNVSGGGKAGPRGGRERARGPERGWKAVLGESGMQRAVCSFSVQGIDGLLTRGTGGAAREDSTGGWLGPVGEAGAPDRGGRGGPGEGREGEPVGKG